jgi:hypothetical protein
MDQVLQFHFEYTEEITLIATGMPDEIEKFLSTANKVIDSDEPVTIRSKAENGELHVVLPQDRYYQQLDAANDSLFSDRGVDQIEEAITVSIALPVGLMPYLDEFPDWLQPHIVKPVPGFLSHPILLPQKAVEEWNQAISTLNHISEAYNLEPTMHESAATSRSTSQTTIDGFLVIEVRDRGMECNEYIFNSDNQTPRTIHAYSFVTTQTRNRMFCKIRSGSGNVRIDVAEAILDSVTGLLPPGWWPANMAQIPPDKEVLMVIRKHNGDPCKYSLRGGCEGGGSL